jgi:DNA-binding NarL/FixJ family response regulator
MHVWVALDDAELVDEAIAILSGRPEFDVRAAPWPGRTVHESPTVLLGPIEPPEQIAALRERLVGLEAVLLVASDPSVDTARRGLVAGADAVLLSGDLAATLPAAIHAAVAGLLVLSPALGFAIARPSLTAREKQILALVVMGMSNGEIAERLVVAESTVKSHLFSAYRRLGVRTRREAVGVITDPDRGLGSGILGLTQN